MNYEVNLIGSRSTTCTLGNLGAMWDPGQPRCERKYKCLVQSLVAPLSNTCTNENYANSRCDFACPANYRIRGAVSTTCREAGDRAIWDNESPTCEAICNEINNPENGRVQCTNFNFLHSKCTFQCDGGFKQGLIVYSL